MVDNKIIEESFCKCAEPMDYVHKYSYFKLKNKIKDDGEILATLRCIEKIDLLGTLYIVEIKEESIRESYIAEFIVRNRELFTDKIQNDNNDILYYMQVLYLCLMNVSNEKCLELCKDIFSGDVYRRVEPKLFEFTNPEYVTKHYARVFASAVTKFSNKIAWGKKYCSIATAIFKARNEDISFLRIIEMKLRKNPLGYVIDDESAKEYFDLLCKNGAYESAKIFLDNFDGSKMFLGMQPDELISMLYRLPAPELLAFGRWYIKRILNREYTSADWLADVVRYNHDQECIKWTKLTVYYLSLQKALETDDIDGFEKLLECSDDYEIFDMDRFKYMKQIVESFAFVTNMLLVSYNKKLIDFLKKIESININEYSRTKYLYQWNQVDSVTKDYDYNQIEKLLFENYTIEESIYIYMNSHLKSIITIDEFVKLCAEKSGEELYELFKGYPLWGQVFPGSKLSSVRDKIFITPIGIASNVSHHDFLDVCEAYGPLSKEAHAFKKRMIRNHQQWYSYNKKQAELMKGGDFCTFYIKSYKKNVGIFATDLSLDDKLEERRIYERNNNYPGILLSWLSEMQASGEYVEWNDNNSIYGVRHLESISIRSKVALAILDTILAFQSNVPALEKFVYAITNAPLEEINEFRYIPTQRRLKFEYPTEDFRKIRKEVITKANIVMRNESIPIECKKDIYLNTCIRKIYDLQEACKYIGRELYLTTADEPFVMALIFEKKDQDFYYFSTNGRSNTLYSTHRFRYKGQGYNLNPNYVYLVTLKEYDFKERCFVLENINLSNDQTAQWQQYLRRVRDIKKVTDASELSKIKKDLGTYQVKVTSERHISQFVYELNVVFKRQDYSIESALKTLEVIKSTNPFRNQDKDFSIFAESFYKSYYVCYTKFLEDYKERYKSVMGFCDLFFSSYLKVFISYDDFIDDITNDEGERQSILNYCKLVKQYIQ